LTGPWGCAIIGSQLAGGAPCHGLYFDEARLVCAGGPFFVARVALSARSLRGRGGATYTVGNHPIADGLRSLHVGDKTVQYIYAPRLQRLLYPGRSVCPGRHRRTRTGSSWSHTLLKTAPLSLTCYSQTSEVSKEWPSSQPDDPRGSDTSLSSRAQSSRTMSIA